MAEKIRSQHLGRCLMLCLVSLGCIVSLVQAQTRLTIHQSTAYDQNILRNYSQTNDWISHTAINLQHLIRPGKVEWQAEYAGDLNLFYYYRNRLTHAHRIGLAVMLPLREKISWQVEAAAQLRKHQSPFDVYDHHTWLGASRWQLHVWQRSPVQAGYQFRYRSYWDLPEFTYSEQFVFLTIKHFFPTRTTIIGELNWGHKTFAHGAATDKMVVNKKSNPAKGHGYQHGKRQQLLHSDSTVTAYNLTASATQQWRLSLLLAQSVLTTTGISLQYKRQLTPSRDNRYLLGVDYFYYQNDDLFDDPYSFESHEWEATLTQILPWSATMKLNAYRIDKRYGYSIAPDSLVTATTSITQRQDRQLGLEMSLSKRVRLNHLVKSLTISLSVNYLSNRSNDLYFDYRGYFVYAGCGFTL